MLSSVDAPRRLCQRGLAAGAQTALPFDVDGADVLVLDDVLFTGRTIRAVLNELFDYGRPPAYGWRCWWTGWPPVARAGRLCCRPRGAAGSQSLALARNEQGTFQFQVQEA